MNKTAIGWCDYSVNPLRYRDESGRVVWACVKTSEGCANCYAETLAVRWKRGREFTVQNMRKLTPFLDAAEMQEMRTSKKIAGKRVFVCVSGDSLVTMADGTLKPISAVRPGEHVMGYQDGRLHQSAVLAIHQTTQQKPYLLKAGGTSIRASSLHRFATISGYLPITDLVIGMRVGILANYDKENQAAVQVPNQVGDEEVSLLGYSFNHDLFAVGLPSRNHRRRRNHFFSQDAEGLLPPHFGNHQYGPFAYRSPSTVLLAEGLSRQEQSAGSLLTSWPNRVRHCPISESPTSLPHYQTTASSPHLSIRRSASGTSVESATFGRDAGNLPRREDPQFAWAGIESIQGCSQRETLFDLTTSTANFIVNGFLTHNCDMTDLFGQWVDDGHLNELFSGCLEMRSDVTWQILTKRATIMRDYFAWRWRDRIPCSNIHVGVSVEDTEKAWRINWLRDTPAALRWVSFEPLIGPIENVDLSGIHWAVIGGESGANRRPCEVDWIRSLVDQCDAAGVRVYVKQDSAFAPGKQGRIPLDLWQRKEAAV